LILGIMVVNLLSNVFFSNLYNYSSPFKCPLWGLWIYRSANRL
jgi:hypothetical protein